MSSATWGSTWSAGIEQDQALDPIRVASGELGGEAPAEAVPEPDGRRSRGDARARRRDVPPCSTAAPSRSGRGRAGRERSHGGGRSAAPRAGRSGRRTTVTPCRQTTGGAAGVAPLVDVQPSHSGLLAVPGGAVVGAALQLVGEVVDVEAGRVVVRVDVAGARGRASSRPRSARRGARRADVPPPCSRTSARRLPERGQHRVRLRRAREVDRRLREVQPRLGQADVLDAPGRRRRRRGAPAGRRCRRPRRRGSPFAGRRSAGPRRPPASRPGSRRPRRGRSRAST